MLAYHFMGENNDGLTVYDKILANKMYKCNNEGELRSYRIGDKSYLDNIYILRWKRSRVLCYIQTCYSFIFSLWGIKRYRLFGQRSWVAVSMLIAQLRDRKTAPLTILAETSSTCAFGFAFILVAEKMPDVTSQLFPEIFIDLKADIGLIYKQNASHLRSKMRQIERFRCESWNMLVLYLLLNR